MNAMAAKQANAANEGTPAAGLRWRIGLVVFGYLSIILSLLLSTFSGEPRILISNNALAWPLLIGIIVTSSLWIWGMVIAMFHPLLKIPYSRTAAVLISAYVVLEFAISIWGFLSAEDYRKTQFQGLIGIIFLLIFGICHLREIHRRLKAVLLETKGGAV